MSSQWTEEELAEWHTELEEDLSREQIESFLDGLPDATEPEYYPQLRTLFSLEETSSRNKIMRDILESDHTEADTTRELDDIRFAAFYFLANYYRRKSDPDDLSRLLSEWDEFRHRTMYKYQESILHRERNEYPEAIDKCRPIVDEFPDNYPVAGGFAHNIIHGIEEGLVRDTEKQALAEEVIDKIDPVIQARPEYGKSYLIRGRALAVVNRFGEAIDDVNRAIEFEDSSKEDYAERIADRYFHKMRIEVAQQQYELTKKTETVTRRIDNIQSRFVQLLGFFAAILAVVFTSTQIAVSLEPAAAVGLILVLSGGLITGFGNLILLLPGDINMRRVVIVIAMGIIGIVSGAALVIALQVGALPTAA